VFNNFPKNSLRFFLVFLCVSLFSNYSFAATNYYNYDLYDDLDDVEEKEISDPLEKMNRKIFTFNLKLNQYILEPTAKGYRKVSNKRVRTSVRNFLRNLNSPMVLFNSVLQLDGKNSAKTVGSFVLNSTVGVLGLFDPAKKIGINPEKRDFGQTLGKYGVGTGSYLVLPFFGPSNLRDSFGLATDRALDPLSFNVADIGKSGGSLLNSDQRIARNALFILERSDYIYENFSPLIKSSFDPYVMARDAYLQFRENKVKKVKK